jgi:hypothetical protein
MPQVIEQLPVDQDPAERPDPLNPAENTPSELDELTHNEFVTVYRDSSDNIRFAKLQQWRAILYFSFGAAAVTGFSEWTGWRDDKLSFYLLVMVWLFSLLTVLLLLAMQWWQGVEHAKIDYVTSKWSSFTNAARGRKSSLVSDLQRYGMLGMMILYLELASIAVTQVYWPHIQSAL